MYKVIRCGERYCLVIAVTPADATPKTKDAKFYRLADWQIEDHQPGVFNEISRETAIGYFSGHADGLGRERLPQTPFESLEAIGQYINEQLRQKAATAKIAERYADRGQDEERRQ